MPSPTASVSRPKLNAKAKTKPTPAGEIPVDWEWGRLGELVRSLESGVSVGGSEFVFDECQDGTFVLKVSAVTSGKFMPTEVKLVRSEDLSRLRKHVVGNSVLVNRANGSAALVGTAVYSPTTIRNTFLPDKIWQIQGKHGRSLSDFLAYLLSSPSFRQKVFDRSSGGTGMRNISSRAYLSIPVPIPPLSEQRRMAAILGAWDRIIEIIQRLVDAKTRRKNALMQSLLTGKIRLPRYSGAWRTVKIGDLLKEIRRPVEWDDNATYRLVSVRRRSGGLFYRESLKGHQILTKVMKVTCSGDFLIAKMQVVHGAMAMTTDEFDGAHVSGSYTTLIPRDRKRLFVPFFDYLSRLPRLYHFALISSYGVVIEKMTFNLPWFLKCEITIPPTIDEQRAIVQILASCDCELALLTQQLESFRTQKRGLMQKLLMGAIRAKAE